MTDPTTTDAPSLVSMLAKMWIAVLGGDERIRRGADPAEVLAKAQADINRTERAVLDLVRGLRDERGDARLATHVLVNVPGQQTDVARYYCDECAVRNWDVEEATFAADVRRIAELLGEASDG